ncbi:dTDP-4-amino-4,6-dideoxygalactose transaminase [Negadavirga shengliensis]|uniref:dTDP-4-amino-4,6-dideoxygalactose transaminase n=1 Tax=Negadavirga shengliensis TaxID=1389218 RepID=A0ABV9T699_9BACT
MYKIPFNKPYFTGKETKFIHDALAQGKLSANGKYTGLCQHFFEQRYGFYKTFLTNSCTQALEMTALLMDIRPGDEVIVPSYTFVSTANAFALRGARIVFADSRPDYPGVSIEDLESLITARTKAIVLVHYGGIACDMQQVMGLAGRHGLFVVEDAAAALDAFYINGEGEKQALGTFGHFAAFSFHETKNISSGEGGMLVVNDSRFLESATEIWERGTNRSAFLRGEVERYDWVSLGSAYAPSEITAACLWAQLQHLDDIQSERKRIWEWYDKNLGSIWPQFDGEVPHIPLFSQHNFHMYYLVCTDQKDRDLIISRLGQKGVLAVFHYQCLHRSPFYSALHDGRKLLEAEKYSQSLLRLPFYYGLDTDSLKEMLKD